MKLPSFLFPIQRGEMSLNTKPVGAPGCWGQQYTDGDRECVQCPWKASCSQTCLQRSMAAPNRQYLPMYPPTPPQAPIPPLPQRPFVPQMSPTPSAPAPVYYRPPQPTAPAPAPVVQYQQPYQQQYQQLQIPASIPDPYNPNPMVPMMRPGAPGPAYYFCQYPGESITTRLAKNMTLRAGEAVLGEAMSFCRHWTWPPRS